MFDTYESRFYEHIKNDLETNWKSLDIINEKYNFSNGKSSRSPDLGSRFGINPYNYGFVIYDWNDQFLKNINKIFYEKMLQGKTLDPNVSNNYNMRYKHLGIPFQYIEALPQWNKSANWNDVGEVMGRFESQTVYSNSSAQELSISLDYYAESSDDKPEYNEMKKIPRNINPWTMTLIERIKLQLQSLVFPQYDGQFSPPVKVLLNIGNLFVDVPVVIKNVSIEELPPFEINTLRGMRKKITIEMRTSYPSWQCLSAPQVWTSDNGGIFAKQDFETITG